MKRKIIAIGILGMFLLTGVASLSAAEMKTINGKTIYVSHDNPEGPWDGTLEHPYCMIHQGISAAEDGDTVFVFGDEVNYRENIVIDKKIKLEGENRESTIIEGVDDDVIWIKSSSVSISGFTITGAPYDRCSAGILAIEQQLPPSSPLKKLSDISISNCNIESNGLGIRLDYVKNVEIIDCEIKSTTSHSIYVLMGSSDITIDNCQIHDNGKPKTPNDYGTIGGIMIWGPDQEYGNSENIEILNCDIYNNEFYGICLQVPCPHVEIHNNNIFGNTKNGITILGPVIDSGQVSDIKIHDNIITDNGEGGAFDGGIDIERDSGGITIKDNEITMNDPNGIHIFSSSGNTIIDNDIKENVDCGIYIENGGIESISKNNKIYHNNFIDNAQHAYDAGLNEWDNGYKRDGGGNYWSGFDEPDEDDDGIIDTKYEIPGGINKDRYPLAEQDGRPNAESSSPFANFLQKIVEKFPILGPILETIIERIIPKDVDKDDDINPVEVEKPVEPITTGPIESVEPEELIDPIDETENEENVDDQDNQDQDSNQEQQEQNQDQEEQNSEEQQNDNPDDDPQSNPVDGPDDGEEGIYTLTININGGGTVSASPEKDLYEEGEMVTLTANPNSGRVFDHWEGDVTSDQQNDNPLTITMNSDKTVTAYFVLSSPMM